MPEISTCRIWGSQFHAVGRTVEDPSRAIVEESPRAGGGYEIKASARNYLNQLNDTERARLTTWLIDQRTQGVERPMVTQNIIEYIRNNRPLMIHERAIKLLRYFVGQTEMVGAEVSIGLEGNRNEHGEWVASTPLNMWNAMAWSESVDLTEVRYCVDYLERKGWITAERYISGDFSASVVVTVEGYEHIADIYANIDSSQAFVAMWFNDSMDESYREGIKLGIKDAGFNPFRIDQKEHINKIDDEIIGEIRRSRFLVADFTHGDDGARGGVYYEAGFAHGLDLPVIFTCREDAVETLHFDTNHYNHIVWSTPEELRDKLKVRILAIMGEGPEINTYPYP